MKSIYKVAVIGGGTMGADLAALVARQDMPVVVKELNAELADRFQERLHQRIDSWADKGRINGSRAEQLKMLCSATSTYDDLKDADLIIEAVPEDFLVKRKIFLELGEILPEAILASNTSSIPITLLSQGIKDPRQLEEMLPKARLVSKDPIALLTQEVNDSRRVVGMHFFNPPTKMPLVEIISSELTSPGTVESLEVFAAETLAKKPIRVKDRPGFLVNVILGAYLVPAIRALEDTDVKPEAIDECARRFGWPMGPFVLLDMMGVDVVKEVVNIFFAAYGKRFSPSRLVDVLVKAGRLGQKTGAGFYGGTETLEAILQQEFPQRNEGDAEQIFTTMMACMVNESAIALEQEIASANDIETGSLFGLGFPQAKGGPMHYADEIGVENIVRELGGDACPLLKEMATNGNTFFSSW